MEGKISPRRPRGGTLRHFLFVLLALALSHLASAGTPVLRRSVSAPTGSRADVNAAAATAAANAAPLVVPARRIGQPLAHWGDGGVSNAEEGDASIVAAGIDTIAPLNEGLLAVNPRVGHHLGPDHRARRPKRRFVVHNLALNASCVQSTTVDKLGCHMAMNNDSKTFSRTAPEAAPWMEIDLGFVFFVDSIQLRHPSSHLLRGGPMEVRGEGRKRGEKRGEEEGWYEGRSEGSEGGGG